MAELRYRNFLTAAGEPPVLPDDFGTLLARRSVFQEASGLPDACIHSDPLVAVPLPIYPPSEGAPARWPGLATFMWHPLAWLPGELARPAGRSDDAFTAHALRVWASTLILSLSGAGLFDAERGWVDVAATFGIDLADAATIDRLEAWKAGASDRLFDTIEARLGDRVRAAFRPGAIDVLLPHLGGQHARMAAGLDIVFSSLPNPIDYLDVFCGLTADLLGDAVTADGVHVDEAVAGLRAVAEAGADEDDVATLRAILGRLAESA